MAKCVRSKFPVPAGRLKLLNTKFPSRVPVGADQSPGLRHLSQRFTHKKKATCPASNETLIVIGAAQAMTVSPLPLLRGRRSVKGWYSGTAMDSQDTLKFSVLSGVRSMSEVFPRERVTEAYERMESGKTRFSRRADDGSVTVW